MSLKPHLQCLLEDIMVARIWFSILSCIWHAHDAWIIALIKIDSLKFVHIPPISLGEPRLYQLHAIVWLEEPLIFNKHICLGFSLKCKSGLSPPSKIPVLIRSFRVVEKGCIHEDMSVIEGSGRGRIHRWEGLVHGSVFAVGGPDSPQDEEAWPYEHIHGRADTSTGPTYTCPEQYVC